MDESSRKGPVTELGLGLSDAVRDSGNRSSQLAPLDKVGDRHRGRIRFVVTTHRVCNPPFEWSGLRKHPDVGLEPIANVETSVW